MTELETLRSELTEAIDALTATARRLKTSARESVNKQAEYDLLKSNYKIQIEAEDKLSGVKGRTIPVIEAMYRSRYHKERLAAHLAKIEYESDVLLWKGLQAKLNAIQTKCRLIESEMKMV